VVASEVAIEEAVTRYYEKAVSYDEVMEGFDEKEIEFGADEEALNILDLEKASSEAPVIRLVNAILINAIKKGASDIHVEPYEKNFRVRYRVDGVLYEEMQPPLKLRNAITSRLKIMSTLDIAERRLPQDGRIKLKLGKGREMDFRVSVLPTLFGEKWSSASSTSRTAARHDQARLRGEAARRLPARHSHALRHGAGHGPDGLGKTTTLYSALSELNKSTENISPPRTPSSTTCTASTRCRCTTRSGLNFATACAPSCGRTPTSSWSARSATSRPPRSRSRPR